MLCALSRLGMLVWSSYGRRAVVLAAALVVLSLVTLWGCDSRRDVEDLLGGRAPSSVTHASNSERLTDGVHAVAGGAWNSNLASVMTLGASIEWDLGASEPIAAAYLQADNNDEYALLVSDDRRHWQSVWVAASVSTGGQQARVTRELSTRGRFVRLEPRGGDGSYAATELALFRKSTVSLPPALLERRGGEEASVQRRELVLSLALAAFLLFSALLLRSIFGSRSGSSSDSDELRAASRARERWMLLGGAVALVAVTAWLYRGRYRGNTIDDAYISFQYAKNWASGQGLVFNPGERVEGYSNFLWVALLTPLWPLSGRHPDAFAFAAFALALTLALAALLLIARIAAREFAASASFLLAVLLVAFDDAFVTYAVFALETHLMIVSLLAALYCEVARFRGFRFALGACFALVAMTRLDGALFAFSYFAVEALRLLRSGAGARRLELAGLCRTALCFLLPFGAYFAVRYHYYGQLLPNTFYLKVGDSFAALPRGLSYAHSFLSDRWYVPLLALLGLAAWKQRRWVPWLFLHVLCHVAYVIYVGGDFYSGQRFLLPLTPALALLTAAGVEACLLRWPRRFVADASVLAGAALCLLVRFGTLSDGPAAAEIRVWGDEVDNNVRYMRWLKQVARPSASLVLGDIGGAGFFADLRVLDVYGVVDATLAHRRVEGFGTGKAGHEKVATLSELLPRRPSYIKLGFIGVPDPLPGYYVFNDFPLGLDVEGLLVRDDLAEGQSLREGAFHMDPDELAGFSREGDAFAAAPSAGTVAGQRNVAYAVGNLVNSFTLEQGDRATGRLLSPPFTLLGERMRLLVGGGRDPERLRVSLLVDGCKVFSETGTNHEVLGRREWDIAKFRGKSAALEIVDSATGAWGHLLVDEVSQWQGRPNSTGKL